jgi:hypothetical protein
MLRIDMYIHLSSRSFLFISLFMLLTFTGISYFAYEMTLDVHAQMSASCDGFNVSQVQCTSLPSSSSSSSSSSGGDSSDIDNAENNNDHDEEKGSDNMNDEDDNKNGDIESKIPSLAGSGVPFP